MHMEKEMIMTTITKEAIATITTMVIAMRKKSTNMKQISMSVLLIVTP